MTGLSVQTTVVCSDDGDDDGLSTAELGAAIGVPIAAIVLLGCWMGLSCRHTRGRKRDEQHKASVTMPPKTLESTEEGGQGGSGANANPLH